MARVLEYLGDLELFAVRNKGTAKYLTDDEARGCYVVEHVSLKELFTNYRTHNFRGIFDTYEEAQEFLRCYLEVNEIEDEWYSWDVVYLRFQVVKD